MRSGGGARRTGSSPGGSGGHGVQRESGGFTDPGASMAQCRAVGGHLGDEAVAAPGGVAVLAESAGGAGLQPTRSFPCRRSSTPASSTSR